MDPGVIEVRDMLVIAEALLYEPPLVVHPVYDQGVGVQVGFKDDGAEPLVALLHVLGIERLALVVREVVGLFFCRPSAVIERVQPIVLNLLLLEQHVYVVVIKHPDVAIHAVHGDPLVVPLDRAEPVQVRRGRKGLLGLLLREALVRHHHPPGEPILGEEPLVADAVEHIAGEHLRAYRLLEVHVVGEHHRDVHRALDPRLARVVGKRVDDAVVLLQRAVDGDVVTNGDRLDPLSHEGDYQRIRLAQILQERGDAVLPQRQAGEEHADPALLIIMVEPAAGHPRVAHPQQGDHIDAHGIGSGVNGVQFFKQQPRHRVDQDGFGIVLEFNLPLGDGFDAGEEGTLHDVAHRVAVHRDIAFADALAANPLHHRIHEGAVASPDHYGILGSLDLSNSFRYGHDNPSLYSVYYTLIRTISQHKKLVKKDKKT